jgi:glycosyltransferase involved in cell wall biosynthesis
MEHPKVTVLLPVYNGDRFLQEAIDSVLSQTWNDFELLVVNDESIDGTAAILEGYNDPRVHIITNASRIGLPSSLNCGLAHARGEYVARIDADDVALPQRLAEQVWYLDHHPDVGLVASSIDIIDKEGTKIGSEEVARSPEELYYLLTFKNCIANCSVTFRRELILGIGGYHESMMFAEDYDLWVRVSRRVRIAKLDKILAQWRNTETSISSRHKAEQAATVKKIVLKNLQNLMGDSINVNEALCFHDVWYERDLRITYSSLLQLERMHERLIAERPKGLREAEIQRHCNYAIGRYIALMALNGQIHDVVHALLNVRYQRSLIGFVGRKLTLLG